MNTEPVVSLHVAADLSAYSHVAVKLTSTGINLASAGDRVIGTMIRGNAVAANTGDAVIGRSAAVYLSAGHGLNFVTVGTNNAIACGDELELWSSGRYAKRGATISGTGEADDDLITITDHGFVSGQAVTFSTLTGGAGLTVGLVYYVIAAGLTSSTFSVSATSGGSAVNISTDYSVVTVRPAASSPAAALAVDSAPASNVSAIIRAIVLPSSVTAGQATATYSVDGAIAIMDGVAFITKGSAAAMTIAAPTAAQTGTRLTIMANSDYAHVITFTGTTLLDGTTGANSTATTAAFKGSGLTVIATSGGTWLLEAAVVCAIAP